MSNEQQNKHKTIDDVTHYEQSPDEISALVNRFTYHSADESQTVRYRHLRDKALQLAMDICAFTPKSREQSLALTKLEETVMFANAAIARNE